MKYFVEEIKVDTTLYDQVNIKCDRTSEKGPSGHIKFDHLFQLCCITKKIYLRN